MAKKMLGKVVAGAALGGASLLVFAPGIAFADGHDDGKVYAKPHVVKAGDEVKLLEICPDRQEHAYVWSKVTGKVKLKPAHEDRGEDRDWREEEDSSDHDKGKDEHGKDENGKDDEGKDETARTTRARTTRARTKTARTTRARTRTARTTRARTRTARAARVAALPPTPTATRAARTGRARSTARTPKTARDKKDWESKDEPARRRLGQGWESKDEHGSSTARTRAGSPRTSTAPSTARTRAGSPRTSTAPSTARTRAGSPRTSTAPSTAPDKGWESKDEHGSTSGGYGQGARTSYGKDERGSDERDWDKEREFVYYGEAKVDKDAKPGRYELKGSCGEGELVVLPHGGVDGGDGGVSTGTDRGLATGGAGLLGAAALGGIVLMRRRRTDGSLV